MNSRGKWRAFTAANKRAKEAKSQLNARVDTQVLEAFKDCCQANQIEMQVVIEQAMRDYVEQMAPLSLVPRGLDGK